MEPYFVEYFFIEEVVVLPVYLDHNLFENLRSILTQKYNNLYINKGYIFNINIVSILDNYITLSNQIIFKIKFKVDLYTPQVNHVFQGRVKKSSLNNRQWVEIGPLTIFLKTNKIYEENQPVTVKIVSVKSDYTLCFGHVLN